MARQSTAVAPIVGFRRNLTALIGSKELPLLSNASVGAFRNAAIVAAQDHPQPLAL